MNIKLSKTPMLFVMTTWILAASFAAPAADKIFLINYDLLVADNNDDGNVGSIQQQGIRFSPEKNFHGWDLGQTDYYFTISEFADEKGKLIIEIYKFATREKDGPPISEFVTEVEFTLGTPARLQTKTNDFSVDLAFSINQR